MRVPVIHARHKKSGLHVIFNRSDWDKGKLPEGFGDVKEYTEGFEPESKTASPNPEGSGSESKAESKPSKSEGKEEGGGKKQSGG
jgi:hypothetical protein